MAYPEESKPAENIPDPEELENYGVQDWADAILDQMGDERSGDKRIRKDAGWDDPDSLGRYELTRTDKYDRPNESPYSIYHLKAFPDHGDKFVGYFYNSHTQTAARCDMKWKKIRGSADKHTDEMLGYLQTAPLDALPPDSLAAPTAVAGILREIQAQNFNRRSLAGRTIAVLLNRFPSAE